MQLIAEAGVLAIGLMVGLALTYVLVQLLREWIWAALDDQN